MRDLILGTVGAIGVIAIVAWMRRRRHRIELARVDAAIQRNAARTRPGMNKADEDLAVRTLAKRAAIEAELRDRRRELVNPQIVQPHDAHVTPFRRRA